MRAVMIGLVLLGVAGCGGGMNGADRPVPASAPSPAGVTPPQPLPKPVARSAAALDTTTVAERAAAARKPAGAETRLGETVASLGDPGDPGFWLRTGLVQAEAKGRVEDRATGKSAQVTLLPLGKAEGAGSEISLPALRLLGLPVTALPDLAVYRM